MTFTDYLITAALVLVVLRQLRERRLELRSFVAPLVMVAFVAHIYIHSLPTAGNDLVLTGLLTSVGVTLGLLSGLTTRIRREADGAMFVRVSGIAAALLLAGIGSRVIFALAVQNGAGAAIRTFSIAHHIGAAAWPVALVAMALCEVSIRLLVVAVRSHHLQASPSSIVCSL